MTVNAPTDSRPRQIAIVGGGPRGLQATERLLHHLAEAGTAAEITVFDHRPLGHGAAYDTSQPDSWLINVTARVISSHLGGFNQWRERRGESATDHFPPRSSVGEFFGASWRELTAHLPRGCRFRYVSQAVSDIAPAAGAAGNHWRLRTADGRHREFAEVLLATGHATSWPGALPPTIDGVPTTPVYPAHGLRSVASGDTVLVRGAALSFLDATLALTVERGGSFTAGDSGVRYVPSGEEPSRILPVSRSNRFLVVKPTPGTSLTCLDLTAATRAGDAAIRLAGSTADLVRILGETASSYLRTAGVRAPDTTAIRAVLDGTDASGDPVTELRCSLAVAQGQRTPGAEWAVGEAWRRLYPAIIWRTSYGGRADLPGFHELSRRLERVGFGPPPATVERLLALIDAGVVDTSLMTAGSDDLPWAVSTTGADVVVDAVLAPQGVVSGTLVGALVEQGLAELEPSGRGLAVERDGTVTGQEHLAVVGRETEDTVLGNDSLNRALHDVIERWARRVTDVLGGAGAETLERGVHGEPPLTARLEPWERQLLGDPARCAELVAEYGSPVNVLHPGPMERNIAELVEAGADLGVPVQVFFARKANKALGFVDRVRDLGHGVDVASHRELAQVLDRGVKPERIILSAAIKPDPLLELAVSTGVCVSVDSVAELHRVAEIAATRNQRARVAPRLAPDPAHLPPTRFGERLDTWTTALPHCPAGVDVVGVHVHLHGYSATDRRTALGEALQLVDAAARHGHLPQFVDLGGGVPMSYLDDRQQWETFLREREAMNAGEREPFTWKADPLRSFYPFHQQPTRGDWLRELLGGPLAGGEETAAAGLIRRGLHLHLEPGRSLLDGCGLILTEVAFRKERSDGLPLIGVAMNRTQCRTTSDDILLDPVLVRQHPADPAAAVSGFLVGAYCIEDELIIRRRLNFPGGVKPGDLIAIPNTAGYFMHILESASHQIPLARNVVLTDPEAFAVRPDDIDG